jgi:hypothetical protein
LPFSGGSAGLAASLNALTYFKGGDPGRLSGAALHVVTQCILGTWPRPFSLSFSIIVLDKLRLSDSSGFSVGH